jgi:hypothetical protein
MSKNIKNFRSSFFSLALFSLGVSSLQAQNWLEYINKTDLFIVNFPGEPEVREITHESAFEAIFPARVYSVESDSGLYSVTVVDYRESEKIHSERTDRTEANSSNSVWVTDVRASVAHAAQLFRLRGGDITYDAWADIDKIEGQQLQITNPDQSRSFIGIHLHDSRLYILEATVSPGRPPPGLFQQSLGILDEEGRRIRYLIDAEGRRTRMQVMHEWIGVDPERGGQQLIK